LGLICMVMLGSGMTPIGTVLAAKFSATMAGGNEVPPVQSNAIGITSFRTAANDAVIKYKINVTGFSDATGAHIHMGKVGSNGDVVVDLMQGSKNNPTKLGLAIRGNITDSKLTGPLKGKTIADLISAMKSGDTYVNVHTDKNPKGEIRGQIQSGGGSSSNQTNASSNQSSAVNMTTARG
jgi:CHRD domain